MDRKHEGQNFGCSRRCVVLPEVVLADVPEEVDQMGHIGEDD